MIVSSTGEYQLSAGLIPSALVNTMILSSTENYELIPVLIRSSFIEPYLIQSNVIFATSQFAVTMILTIRQLGSHVSTRADPSSAQLCQSEPSKVIWTSLGTLVAIALVVTGAVFLFIAHCRHAFSLANDESESDTEIPDDPKSSVNAIDTFLSDENVLASDHSQASDESQLEHMIIIIE
jgi:hypothetical protein